MVSLGQSKMGGVYYDPNTGKKKKVQKPEEPQKWAINQTKVAKEDYERLKRTPEFVQSTYKAPENIRGKVPIEQRTPEQQQITGELGLREQASIEQLKKQILEPDLSLRTVGESEKEGAVFGAVNQAGEVTPGEVREGILTTTPFKLGKTQVQVPNEQVSIFEGQKQIKGLITTRIDKDTNYIKGQAQLLYQQIIIKFQGKITGSLAEAKMANMEASLINHKESSAQVIQALQRNAYTPQEAMERLEMMVTDANIIEETMKLLAIHAPAVYAENRGWEYVTRLQKIREAILSNEQAVINFAETGQVLPADSGALALQLNELQLK